jgi:hypothetical protein
LGEKQIKTYEDFMQKEMKNKKNVRFEKELKENKGDSNNNKMVSD